MKKLLLAPIAAVAMLSTGCATIVSDSEYPVSISSSPSEAAFQVFDQTNQLVASGTTPQVVTLSASDDFASGNRYTIIFEKPGYGEQVVPVKATLDGWFIGNVFLGGFIGMAVDAATGAMYKLPPNVAGSLTAQQSGLTIIDIAQIPEDQRASLERIN